jgi:2-amino-4-hydroxy-6-hydroxymethyldihydropteridine diphosphokinase
MKPHQMKSTKLHAAYISVGSNMGNKKDNCRRGIAALVSSGDCELKKQSSLYNTEPVDFKEQEWFVNCVVKVTTTMDPFELFKTVKRIESSMGRLKDSTRFGPRILDLDILLYDNRVIFRKDVIIPHPRMHKRRFVLKPFCDIEPNVVHPILKKTMQELLAQIDLEGQGLELNTCDS